MSLLQIVCFSKDRPLQLHGYLNSLRSMSEHPEQLRVSVLVAQPYGATCPHRATDFATAYHDLEQEFADVHFVLQTHFAANVATLIDSRIPYTAFGVDDAIYQYPFDPIAISNLFNGYPELLATSLRLGKNISTNMFFRGQIIPQPIFLRDDDFLMWQVDQASVDWAYPWELDGTIYHTTFVQRMLAALGPMAQTPNQLEHLGSQCWPQLTPKRTMAAYPTSRLVVPTVNVVQNDFQNGVPGALLTTEQLLIAWMQGIRLDLTAFNQPYSSIHIEHFHLRKECP